MRYKFIAMIARKGSHDYFTEEGLEDIRETAFRAVLSVGFIHRITGHVEAVSRVEDKLYVRGEAEIEPAFFAFSIEALYLVPGVVVTEEGKVQLMELSLTLNPADKGLEPVQWWTNETNQWSVSIVPVPTDEEEE